MQINTSNQRGGAARIAFTIHEYLNKTFSYQSIFAYGRNGRSKIKYCYKFTLDHEIYFHAFLARVLGLEGSGSYLSTVNLLKYIDVENPDLVHLHNIHGYCMNFEMLIDYLKEKDIPVVWTFHDCWPITGSCAYFLDCNKYLSGCGNCPYKQNYPKNYLDASDKMLRKKMQIFASGWSPIIVTPSYWLADIVKDSYLKNHRVEVIPNGIDVRIFKPVSKDEAKKKIGIPIHKRVILYVAADLKDHRKGAKYFFNAMREIGIRNDLVVVTVGEKNKVKLYESIDLREYGFITDKNYLSTIYSAADVFCITSLDENFCLTILEAMACGTPIVAFGVGGIPEQVTQDCGIIVVPKDSIGLAKAIKDLLIDKEKRDILSLNCRDRVLNNYTREIMQKKYLKLYNELF